RRAHSTYSRAWVPPAHYDSAVLAWVKQTLPILLCALSPCTWAASETVADVAMHGNSEAISKLIASGANVNSPQPDGTTALHWTAYHGDAVATKALLAAGA